MGMIDHSELKPASEFIAGGDDYLKEYISEIRQPKQLQQPPEIPDDSEFDALAPEKVESEPSKYQQKRGQTTAKFAVETLDKIIASMVAVYAHSDSVEDFQAANEDLEDLSEQWGVYFTDANLDLPPWVFALIATGFVLMKKFKAAGSVRKINIEMKKYKDENIVLKNRLDLLTTKNKVLELQKQVDAMEKKNDQSQ